MQDPCMSHSRIMLPSEPGDGSRRSERSLTLADRLRRTGLASAFSSLTEELVNSESGQCLRMRTGSEAEEVGELDCASLC